MSIKLIAVDMDGTFLRDDKSYDRPRFQKQFEELKNLGIHLAIASGNQLFKLQAYFDDYDYNHTYIAENGAYVQVAGEDLHIHTLPPEHNEAVYKFLEIHPDCCAIVCGRKGAYVLDSLPRGSYLLTCNYYNKLEKISDYRIIDDQILKIAMNLNNYDHDRLLAAARTELNGILVPVTSGHQFVDLIMPGIHKAFGLRALQEHLGIDDSEVATFGDNGNDVEMLKQARFGFAMANGAESAKQAANYQIGNNNDDSVLDIFDLIIASAKDGLDIEEQLKPYLKH